MKRLKNTLYTVEDIVHKDGHWKYIKSADGTLFSGRYHTKIKPEDLPEWYIYGRYYKRFGFLSSKGITDMIYVPSHFSDHFLKDDCLYISYGDKITELPPSEDRLHKVQYDGYDERIWGGEILKMLRAARAYSGYNITKFIMKLKEKQEWLKREYPESIEISNASIDLDEYFAKEPKFWSPYNEGAEK